MGLLVPNEPQSIRAPLPAILQAPVTLSSLNFSSQTTHQSQNSIPSNATDGGGTTSSISTVVPVTAAETSGNISMDLDDDPIVANTGGDLENELREFLESGSSLHATTSSNSDDNNLVAQLLMN